MQIWVPIVQNISLTEEKNQEPQKPYDYDRDARIHKIVMSAVWTVDSNMFSRIRASVEPRGLELVKVNDIETYAAMLVDNKTNPSSLYFAQEGMHVRILQAPPWVADIL